MQKKKEIKLQMQKKNKTENFVFLKFLNTKKRNNS